MVKATVDEIPVSIVIPAFNSERTIAGCIESVLVDPYENKSIIVVDDGSGDGTAEIIQEFARKNPCVNVISLAQNRGQANALNVGIVEAAGEVVFLIDADDLWIAGRISLCLSALLRNGAALCYGSVIRFGNNNSDSYVAARSYALNDLFFYNYLTRSSVCFRRDLVKDIGMFDCAISGSDDWDYWVRAWRLSSACFVDQPVVRYRVSSGSTSLSRRSPVAHLYMSRSYIQRKSLSSAELSKRIRHRVAHLICELERGLFSKLSLRVALHRSKWWYRTHRGLCVSLAWICK